MTDTSFVAPRRRISLGVLSLVFCGVQLLAWGIILSITDPFSLVFADNGWTVLMGQLMYLPAVLAIAFGIAAVATKPAATQAPQFDQQPTVPLDPSYHTGSSVSAGTIGIAVGSSLIAIVGVVGLVIVIAVVAFFVWLLSLFGGAWS